MSYTKLFYSYFYTNTRGDISSSLKHNANSLHSYMYDEYGILYDNNPQQGAKITLGNMDASNFTQSHNDYTFQGKEYDSESALNYFGARYLDSFSGTWTTNDIVRGNLYQPETQHRSMYVHDNPVNLIDRYGYSAVGNNTTSDIINGINNIVKGVQNLVMLPKTQNQGNTAGALANQYVLRNNNSQGSVISPYVSNNNFGTTSASQKQETQKQTKLQQIIKTFTGPVAERDHRLFMMLDLFGKDYTNLAQGIYGFFNPDISRDMMDTWIKEKAERELEEQLDYAILSDGTKLDITGLSEKLGENDLYFPNLNACYPAQNACYVNSPTYERVKPEYLKGGVLADYLRWYGIKAQSSADPSCDNRTVKKCTGFENMQLDTVIGLIDFAQECTGCSIIITGGTEVGHSTGTNSHPDGYKIDLQANTTITNYIMTNFQFLKNTDLGPKYVDSLGNEYLYENYIPTNVHWDIKFLNNYE